MIKYRNQAIFICVFILIVIAIYFVADRTSKPLPKTGRLGNGDSKSGDPGHARQSHAKARSGNPVKDFIDAYKTPIEFYGKVADQHGDPVGGASIKILPVNNAFGGDSGGDMDLTSDANGLFSVKGLNGLSIGIVVTKEGYLVLSDRGLDKPASSRSIDYGLSDSKGKRFKDPNNPTLFTLHKIGPVEPLIYLDEKNWNLPVNGVARQIALDSKKGLGHHQIEFRFTSSWNQIPSGKRYGKLFDWKLEARIPGGGFIKNDSDYNFEAPETGYVETIKLEYSATMPQEQWKRSRYGRYFVKFADGTHGRIRFGIDGASDMSPLSMTSWMNLKPGSRNLASADKDGFGMPEK